MFLKINSTCFADIKIEKDLDVTLKELGINLPKLEALRAYLWNEHSVSLPSRDIPSLTLKA